jgi:hypothetical protein
VKPCTAVQFADKQARSAMDSITDIKAVNRGFYPPWRKDDCRWEAQGLLGKV